MIFGRILSLIFFLCITFQVTAREPSFRNPVLYLLDAENRTYLFRGKMPEKEGVFCYECLTQQFNDYLSPFGLAVSADYRLLCVSFLNCSDAKERTIEFNWFSQHPEKGCIWSYPLFGSLIDPRYLTHGLRQMILRKDPDGIQSLMRQIKGVMDSVKEPDNDLVIYLHCHAGKDRTGEAAACYLMQYKGYSYQQAHSLCRHIAGRKLRSPSVNAIRWHAFFLRDMQGYTTIGVIN